MNGIVLSQNMSDLNTNKSDFTRETSSVGGSDITIGEEVVDIDECAQFLYDVLYSKTTFFSKTFKYDKLLEMCCHFDNGTYRCYGCARYYHSLDAFNRHLLHMLSMYDEECVEVKCLRHGSVSCQCRVMFPTEISVKFRK